MARPRRLPLAPPLLALLLAPASPRADATFSSSDLRFQVGELAVAAVNLAGELRGQSIRLEHEDDRLQGELFGVGVDLGTQAGQVSGTLGDQPVQLQVRATGASLAYAGGVGTERISGVVSPYLLTASLGPCAVTLGFIARSYEGMLDCGGLVPPQPVAIAFPASLSSAPQEAQVALAVALLWTARGLAFPPPEPEPEPEPAPEADAGATPEAEPGIPPPVVVPPGATVVIVPPAEPGTDAGAPPIVIAPGAVVVAPPDAGTPPPLVEPGFGGELPAPVLEPGADAGAPDAGTPFP